MVMRVVVVLFVFTSNAFVLVVTVQVPPSTVMPLVVGMLTVPVQVTEPAGTATVSPLAAEFTAVSTSDCEQEAALTVAAEADS